MTQRQPIALLFDLDGTLVDSIELILSSFRYTFRQHVGEAPPDSKWIAGLGTPLFTQLKEFTQDDALARVMIATYRQYQLAHHDEFMRSYEGVSEAMAELRARGHTTAVVTSKMSDLAVRALDFTGLRDTIDVVIGMEDTQRHKPDPEPVRVALAKLGRAANEAVFLGDSPHDIASGNAAGVITVAAQWGPFSRQELDAAKPGYQVLRMAEFPALIARLESAR